MVKRLLVAGFLCLQFNFVQAQEAVSGTYNPLTKIFSAADDEYWIDYFTEGIARIAKDGYMGLMDSTGKIICPVKYDIIYPLEKEVIRMGINGRLGLLNYAGKEIAAAQFDELWPFAEGIARFRDRLTYKTGFVNKEGRIIAKEEYHKLSDFREGMGRYQLNEQYGIISKQGREIPLFTKKDFTTEFAEYNPYPIGEGNDQYERYGQAASIRLLEFSCGLAPVPRKIKNEQQFGFADSSGTMVIPVQYDSVSNFKKGFAAVKKKRLWGVINTKGEVIIPIKYNVVRLTDTCFFIVATKNKWGLADTANGLAVPVEYAFIKYLFSDVFAVFSPETATGKEKTKQTDADRMNWGPSGKWGAVNSRGQTIMPSVYDAIERINNNLAKAINIISRFSLNTGVPRYNETTGFQIFNTAGLIDNATYIDNMTKVGLTYDNRGVFDEHNFKQDTEHAAYIPLQMRQKNGQSKAVVLNAKGVRILETNFHKIHTFSRDIAIVSMLENPPVVITKAEKKMIMKPVANSNNNSNVTTPFFGNSFEPKVKMGVLNTKGKMIIQADFAEVGAAVYYEYLTASWVKDFIPVKRNNKWGVRDQANNIVAPVKYDEITVGYCGAVVSKNGKYGFIDFKGNQLIPFEYDELKLNYSGLLLGKTGGKYYNVDKRGNRTSH